MRHALWYRVRRLSDAEDVEALARLALSCNASAATPVGFVVDGVGIEGISPGIASLTDFMGGPLYTLSDPVGRKTYTPSRGWHHAPRLR